MPAAIEKVAWRLSGFFPPYKSVDGTVLAYLNQDALIDGFPTARYECWLGARLLKE